MKNNTNEKMVIIFDFDGTMYSGKHKFDNIPPAIETARRLFLPQLDDKEYSDICREFPEWNRVTSGKDIVDVIYAIKERYPSYAISPISFWEWQNNSRYDIIIDKNEVIDIDYLHGLCDNYPVYIVSNSSSNHLKHYMNKLSIPCTWFKDIISNRFEEYDRTKEHYYKDILDIESAKPSNTVVIGDSDISDLEPARRLGIETIYIDNANDIPTAVNKFLKEREN